MSEMMRVVQVGVTALRDPATGEFLPAVPLYVSAEDSGKVAAPVFDRALVNSLAEKFRAYKKEDRKQKKAREKKTSAEEIGERLDRMMDAFAEEMKNR